MKKGMIFTLLMIIAMSVSAQTQVFVGPALGLGVNKIKYAGGGNGVKYNDAKISYNVGFPFEIRFNDYIALEPGIFYSNRGEKAFGDPLNIHQIEIPLVAKAGYGQNDTWQVYGIAGFKFGAGIKANWKDKSTGDKYDLDYGRNDGDLKRAYFGLNLGYGGSYKVGPGKIVANFTYDIAMTKMVRGDFALVDGAARQRNLNFNVGYLFQLGGN